MEGVFLKNLIRINNSKGDILHALKKSESIYIDAPELYQYYNWTVYANSVDGTERLMVSHSFGPSTNNVLMGGAGYPQQFGQFGQSTTIRLAATRSVVRNIIEDAKKVQMGALSFLSRSAASVGQIPANMVGSTNGKNRIAFEIEADTATFVTDINVKADFVTRLGSVLTFFLSIMGFLKLCKLFLELLVDKALMKGKNVPEDVRLRQNVLNEALTTATSDDKSVEMQVTTRANPLLVKSKIKKEKNEQKKNEQKKNENENEENKKKDEIQIIVDEATGRRYSFNVTTGVTEWVDN